MLTAASLTHHVVADWLYQNDFAYVHFPEIVDLATVMTGLGLLHSQIPLVSKTSPFWDSTLWTTFPRPFLDAQGVAYAMANAAWCRNDDSPNWANRLPKEIRRPMLKSIKHLFKVEDTFFYPHPPVSSLDHSQSEWLQQASNPSISRQIIAIRHLRFPDHADSPQLQVIVDKLRSTERSVLLHAIAAAERMKTKNEDVVNELRMLLNHRDDEVRAKAICALARFVALDETAIDVAARMLDEPQRFVAFSGLVALTSLDQLPDRVMPVVNRGLVRSLQSCDYDLVGTFSTGFHQWLDDPESHYRMLLQEKNSEYLDVALEVLESAQQALVSLQE